MIGPISRDTVEVLGRRFATRYWQFNGPTFMFNPEALAEFAAAIVAAAQNEAKQTRRSAE